MASASLITRRWDRASLLLALLCVLAAGVVYLENAADMFAPTSPDAEQRVSAPKQNRSAVQEGREGAEDDAALDSAEDAQERRRDLAEAQAELILERPLFTASRRPASAEGTAAKKAVGGLRSYALAATAQEGSRAVALLQRRGGARGYLRLAPGDEHDGWRLLTIGEDGVLFERAEAERRGRAGLSSGGGAPRRLIIDRDGARAPDGE